MEDGHENLKPVRRGDRGGLAGLQNGEHLLQNSSIQCLAHTQHLVEFFLQDYSDEVNRQNPSGMHGELALSFDGGLKVNNGIQCGRDILGDQQSYGLGECATNLASNGRV